MSKMSKMSKAKARLLIQHPFFASLVTSSPWIATRDIPTAATDSKNYYYNPDFMESLTLEECMGVQVHEVWHDALFHVLRRNGRNPRIWNMACDYSINQMIINAGLKLPQGCLLDRELGKNSADVNYDILMKKAEEERKKRREQQEKAQQEQGQGQGQPGGEMSSNPFGDPGDGLKSDVLGDDIKEPAGGGDPAERVKREQEIRERVAQAANVARMVGKMPAEIERLINAILNPRLPWEHYLQEYMTRVVKSDESWAKRNRRFQVYLPTRHSEAMGPIALIGDTSGSISNDDLNAVAAEFRGIAEAVKPERIHMVWADTKVAREDVFEAGDELVFNAKGGGGTDMRVPLAHVAQYEPEVVVLVTDGYTPWPKEEPDYPLIVVCTTDAACPVGQVIRMK